MPLSRTAIETETRTSTPSCEPLPLDGGCPIGVPAWVGAMVGDGGRVRTTCKQHEDFRSEVRAGTGATLVSVVLPDARRLPATRLRVQARRVYELHRLLIGEGRTPARIWNFIPGITEPMGESGADDSGEGRGSRTGGGGLDRYMAFNLGRHDAMGAWFGERLPAALPAATGVGHDGADLVVHTLVLDEPPTPIENPRQRPAYVYSSRYGPKPPCFARASLVRMGGDRTLIVAGTASILGEESLHEGSLPDQLDETLANLRALIENAPGFRGEALERFECVRAYSPDPAHDGDIRACLEGAMDGREVEVVRADLCRSELLVEVEGIVRLGDAR